MSHPLCHRAPRCGVAMQSARKSLNLWFWIAAARYAPRNDD